MDTIKNVQAIVLAAGRSTRFKTRKSKLLFGICGQSMILYPLKVLEQLEIPMTLVLGYQKEEIKAEVDHSGIKDTSFVVQDEQLGTGHAVEQTRSMWHKDTILILAGDTPLITKEILLSLMNEHKKNNATISFLTTQVIDPTGYGRVLEEDKKYCIIEEKNCTSEQRLITRVNAGIYVMSREFLENNIHRLEKNALTGEVYLVDLIDLAGKDGLTVCAMPVPFDFVRGVNTLQELWSVEQIKRSEFIKYWMLEGVQFELAQSIHIDVDVTIGAGSFIGTGVHLLRGTTIGEECFVGAFSIIAHSVIKDYSHIHSHSVIQDSTLGEHVRVGPFARLRENVVLQDYAEVGNFVEVKQSSLGERTKVKHLSYVGNATLGERVNVGAGTIFCNYDGVHKHEAVIENNVFIGSNNTIIAPVTIAQGSYTAAGSTINQDVPENSLAIGRSRQENKLGYAKKLKQKVKPEVVSDDEEDYNFHAALQSATITQGEQGL